MEIMLKNYRRNSTLIPSYSNAETLEMTKQLNLQSLYGYNGNEFQCLQRSNRNFNTEKEKIQEEIDFRTVALLTNDDEFHRLQSELRRSGLRTGMGSLQILNKQLTDNLVDLCRQRRKSTGTVRLSQPATKSPIENKRSKSLPQISGQNTAAVMNMFTTTTIKEDNEEDKTSGNDESSSDLIVDFDEVKRESRHRMFATLVGANAA